MESHYKAGKEEKYMYGKRKEKGHQLERVHMIMSVHESWLNYWIMDWI